MTRKFSVLTVVIGMMCSMGCPPASEFPECPSCVDNDDADRDGVTPAGGDCDDGNDAIHPGATEVCDEVDNDCDGQIDEDAQDTQQWFSDRDGDGFGDETTEIQACTAPPDTTQTLGDCDDTDAAINPNQDEICGNGIDDNCDGGAGDCAKEGLGVNLEVGAVIDAALTGSTAFRGVGTSACGAGDLDGDGYGELIVGAPGDLGEAGALMVVHGTIYVVPGRADWSGTEAVIDDEAAVSLIVNEDGHDDALGRSVACGPDIDGDGTPDFVVAAPLWQGGTAFVMSGALSGDVGPLSTGSEYLLAEVGYFNGGLTEGRLGEAMLLGDLTGDDIVDLVVSAPYEDVDTNPTGQGVVYVLAGPLTESERHVDEADIAIESSWGSEHIGNDLATLDLDGDGLSELIIGGEDAGMPDFGRVYVIPTGGLNGTVQADDVADAVLSGESEEFDYAGHTVRAVGDVDGDGLEDVAVGATGRDVSKGAVYVIRGPDLDGNDDIRNVALLTIGGETSNDRLGAAIAGAADLSGDGVFDLVVGASGYLGARGAVYVFHGPQDTGSVDATEADLQLAGLSASADSGHMLSWAGDTNNDGIEDLLIGARSHDTDNEDVGAVFLMLGSGL
jgi:hypothetical protein